MEQRGGWGLRVKAVSSQTSKIESDFLLRFTDNVDDINPNDNYTNRHNFYNQFDPLTLFLFFSS